MIIAIDGPAGSGKSTTARAVADRLGFSYLDTGAMYRAATLAFQREGIDPSTDAAAVLLHSIRIDLSYLDGRLQVRLNDEDVTEFIRKPEVTAAVSAVAAVPAVRKHLVAEQRRLAAESDVRGGGVVLDGRDIGTHVFPDASLKIFLVASDEVRAARRMSELRGAGISVTYEEVLSDLRKRDQMDRSRAMAPLRKAEDAVEVDTTRLTIEEQVDLVEKLARERSRSHSV